MELKEARALARSVGATIEQGEITHKGNLGPDPVFIVRLGVCRIGDSGTREYPQRDYPTIELAAKGAVIETARVARELADTAREVYAKSDLIFV